MRILLGFLCAAAALATAPAALAGGPSATLATRPARPALTDSTLSALWARHLDALDGRLDAAESEPDVERRAALAPALLRTARALADEPEVSGNRTMQALLLRAHALYEAAHGPVAPTAMGPADLHALRGDDWAEAEATAGRPVLPEVPSSSPPTLAVVSMRFASTPSSAAHLAYPVEAERLVANQARVARRFRGVRGRRTLRLIERTFRRRGLPTDLKYVAVIESALNPQAESSAGARGIWQFMPETATEFGLDSLSVLDPSASTEAAARYLRQLNRMFRGDWQLALAAYNAGPGRVQRLVREHRARTGAYPTFWDLHDDLPRETQAYVPRFIAVTKLLR